MQDRAFFSNQRGLAVVLLPLALITLLAGGCGSSQQQIKAAKDSLERARQAYGRAKADPNVEAYAPVPLIEAGKAMQAAEKADTYKDMEQLSYLAEKKSQIAVNIAEGKMAEKETEQLGRETAEILLQKRAQEARVAKKEAEQARLLAQAETQKAAQAKKEAEARAREAEERAREAEEARLAAQSEGEKAARAKMEAEARKREAEQARLAAMAEAERAEKAKAAANKFKAEADQLMKEVSQLKGQLTERGIVLTMGDVLFATDQSTLSPNANRNVEKLAEFLQKYPNRNVLIEGHTDSVGTDEYNLSLSHRRAEAVKEALVAKGIDPGRIWTKGYGKKYPVASNDNPTGRQLNRRVEVIILNEGVKAQSQFRE
jgi:outer membrane protein OmpA-like peptidoglycan-associated protein